VIEKTVSTGLMQPGEEKTLRVEWGMTIPHDYIPWVSCPVPGLFEHFEADAEGMTLRLNADLPERSPVKCLIVCRALTLEETEPQPPCL
jgi:hypothetical protein